MIEDLPTHEKTDISAPAVIRFAVGLVVAVAVIAWLVTRFELWLAMTSPELTRESRNAWPRLTPPKPLLQTDPRADMDRLLAAENAILGEYRWLDRKAGSVRIPIERAMEIIARRGLPETGNPVPPSAVMPAPPAPVPP